MSWQRAFSRGGGDDAISQVGHYNGIFYVDGRQNGRERAMKGLDPVAADGAYAKWRDYGRLQEFGYVAFMRDDVQSDKTLGGCAFGRVMTCVEHEYETVTNENGRVAGVYVTNGEPAEPRLPLTLTVVGPVPTRNTWKEPVCQFERMYVTPLTRPRTASKHALLGRHRDMTTDVPVPLTYVKNRRGYVRVRSTLDAKQRDEFYLGVVLKGADEGQMSHVLLGKPYSRLIKR